MKGSPTPRTFFLNERQELSTFAKEGGGRAATYEKSQWAGRFTTLAQSFGVAFAARQGTRDPLAQEHYFVAAVPAASVTKLSAGAKAAATGGLKHTTPSFGGRDSRLLGKLGLEMVSSLPQGKALVHVTAAGASRLRATLATLPTASEREQARWVNLDRFERVGASDRVDSVWLDTLETDRPTPTIIRFQPALTRVEIQNLLTALNALVAGAHTRLLRADKTFAGRYWCSALLTRSLIEAVAEDFDSVQSLHAPLLSPFAGSTGKKKRRLPAGDGEAPSVSTPPSGEAVELMPSVAVLDTGIPAQHVALGPYRRNGFRSPDLDDTTPYRGDHGSRVASCIVFGEVRDGQNPPSVGSCRVVDAVVSTDTEYVDHELVTQALEQLAGTAPDIRVFNLSFDAARLDAHEDVKRREYLLKLQDIDNFAFDRDALLVISAGNAPAGVIPDQAYPHHIKDPQWGLGITARSFNGAVCGAFVRTAVPGAVAGEEGRPSPFTRIGPGLCDSPVPGFSAPGGDYPANYAWAPGLGVWVCRADGMWEDRCGTSFSAPLVAREAAFVFQELLRRCPPDVVPYAATVRAWLHLVARRPPLKGPHEALAKRTLGVGFPTAARLRAPAQHSAVFIWQTVLPGPSQVCRVQIPVPKAWLDSARDPWLRLVAAWNTPVNAALTESWATRKVQVRLRPFGGEKALVGGGSADGAYPIIHRQLEISLARLAEGEFVVSDAPWILEVEYDQIGEYAIGRITPPSQRVGLVVELLDAGEKPESPQAHVQALAMAIQMDRLSLPDLPLRTPIPSGGR